MPHLVSTSKCLTGLELDRSSHHHCPHIIQLNFDAQIIPLLEDPPNVCQIHLKHISSILPSKLAELSLPVSSECADALVNLLTGLIAKHSNKKSSNVIPGQHPWLNGNTSYTRAKRKQKQLYNTYKISRSAYNKDTTYRRVH